MNDKQISYFCVNFDMSILHNFSEQIHFFVKTHFSDGWILPMQIALKLLLLIGVFFVVDVVSRILIDIFFRVLMKISKNLFLKKVYKAKVGYSLSHVVSLTFCFFIINEIFMRHPKSFTFLERTLSFAQVLVFAMMCYRFIKALESYYIVTNNHYKITAFKAISDILRIVGIVIFSFIGIAVIFGIKAGTILGSIGAITAILVLVFRDTILGFVTGIHVSTSKNMKVGDWIGIPKYNIEGNIQEISLLTTKILNFDKSISTIPTYDLLTTEIKNHQIMYDGSMRRIKRAIFFNIKSFKFVDDEMYEKLAEINLISDYLKERYISLKKAKENMMNNDLIINGEQLTNIGVYRNYALNYLKNNSNINQNDILLVRQLEITPQGLPLEIYCFTNKAELIDYEQVQADIFDHLLTASSEFDLEIMQVNKI